MAPSSPTSPTSTAPAWSQVGGGRLSCALITCRPHGSPDIGQRALAKDKGPVSHACWRAGLEGTRLPVPTIKTIKTVEISEGKAARQ